MELSPINNQIETQRLYIRQITLHDAAFLHQLMNTTQWLKYIGDKGVSTVQATRSYIQDKMGANVYTKGFVNHLMIDKESNLNVGTCSLHNREGIDGLDIGCALLPEFEGKGFAKEGGEAMIKLAFEAYNQVKVSAITSVDNVRSYEGLEKNGFIFKRLIQLPNTKEKIKLYQYNRLI